MSYTHCYGLSQRSGGVIGHRLEKASDSFLVLYRNNPELINQFFLDGSKHLPKRRSVPSGEHISRVDTMFFKSRHIAEVE